jgi:putative membrane protein
MPAFSTPARFKPLFLTCLLGLASLGAASAASADAFVDQLAVANAAEIQASQVALQKANFDDTRTLARRLINNHTDLAQQLAELATQLNISLPDDATLKAQAAKLQTPGAKGQSFDAAFATAQIKAHEQAVKLFENEAQTATIPELKAFAVTNLPMMKHHLQMAERLLKTHRH